jgi:hypothetical protein
MNISIHHDLSQAWLDYISTGSTFSDFVADNNDPANNWLKGHTIRVGLKLNELNLPKYYAINMTTQQKIRFVIQEEDVDAFFCKQFNPYRGLRPRPPERKEPGRLEPPPKEIDKCNYRCQDPKHAWSLLGRDPLTVMMLSKNFWACYYNFAPFEEDGHFLWIAVRVRGNILVLPHFPQKITKDFLRDGITLFKNSRGLLFFFNSIHAGASVDHFHFQAVSTRGKRFAIQNVEVPSGKTAHIFSDYPIRGIAFPLSSPNESLFRCIERLNEKEIPHNLIMLGDIVYIIPRNRDHEIVSEFPYGVLGSMEMAGKFIIANEENFIETDRKRIDSALGKTSLNEDELKSLIA